MPYKNPDHSKEYYTANRDKILTRQRAKRKTNKEETACKRLQKAYGITLKEKTDMLATQGGKCALCGTPDPAGRFGVFHVDHCHETGAVRGLLCSLCNTGLGKLGDNLTGLQRAVHYLAKSEPVLFPGIWKRINTA